MILAISCFLLCFLAPLLSLFYHGLQFGIRRLYAGIIVSRLAALLLDLRANGYLIQTVYTVSSTKEGDTLVRKAGFCLMKGKSLAPGRLAYDFVLDEQGVKRLQELSGRGAEDADSSAKDQIHSNRKPIW